MNFNFRIAYIYRRVAGAGSPLDPVPVTFLLTILRGRRWCSVNESPSSVRFLTAPALAVSQEPIHPGHHFA